MTTEYGRTCERRPSSAPLAINGSICSIQVLRRRRRQRAIIGENVVTTNIQSAKVEADEYLKREVDDVIRKAVTTTLANDATDDPGQSFLASFSQSTNYNMDSSSSDATSGKTSLPTLRAIRASAAMKPLCVSLMASALDARPKDVTSFFAFKVANGFTKPSTTRVPLSRIETQGNPKVNGEKASKVVSPVNPVTQIRHHIKILVIGLDNAGKSTMIEALKGSSNPNFNPSLGFCPTSMMYGNNTKITFYDIGGGDAIRNIWKNYFHDIHGIVFVLDASCSSEKYKKSLRVFKEEVEHEYTQGKPVLVFCNKMDEPTRRDVQRIRQDMGLMSRDGQGSTKIQGISLHSRKCAGTSLDDSLDWLIETIIADWENISERVSVDTDEWENKRRQIEMGKERRVFKQSLLKAFGLHGESQSDVLDREAAIAFLAQEVGLECGSDLPSEAVDMVKLVGYQKISLRIVGGMVAPMSKKKRQWSWNEVRSFVLNCRQELGL